MIALQANWLQVSRDVIMVQRGPPKNPLSFSDPLMNNKRHSSDVDQVSQRQVADTNVRNSFLPGPERYGGKLRTEIESMHLLQFMPPVTNF